MLLINFVGDRKTCQFVMLEMRKRNGGKAKHRGADNGCSKKKSFFVFYCSGSSEEFWINANMNIHELNKNDLKNFKTTSSN